MKKNLTKLLMLLGVFLFLGAGNAHAGDFWSVAGNLINNWSPGYDNSDWSVRNSTTNGTIVLSNLPYLKGDFKIVMNWGYGNGTAKYYGYDDDFKKIVDSPSNVEIKRAGGDDGNMYLTKDLVNVTITLKVQDEKLTEMRISGTDPTAPIYPSNVYLFHSIGNNNWNLGQGISSTGNNGVYNWSNVSIIDQGNGNGYLILASLNCPGWDNNDGINANAYGATSNEEELTSGTPAAVNKGWGNVWKVTPGVYNVSLNLATNKITITWVKEIPTTYSYQIHGTIFDGSWDSAASYKNMYKQGDNYILSNVLVTNEGVFGIREINSWGTQTGWYFSNLTTTPQVSLTTANKVVKETSNNGSNFKIGKGRYTFVFNKKNLTLTVTKLPAEITWVLSTDADGTWRDYKFLPSDEDANTWTVSLPGYASGQFGIKKLADEVQDGWFAKSNTSITENNTTNNPLTLGNVSNINCSFNLDPKKIYTFTWNTKTNKLSVAQAQVIYMYGHINGGSWDTGNFTELYWEPKNGLYANDIALIKGQYNEKDIDKDFNGGKNREIWGAAEEAYVAFYPQIQTDRDFETAGTKHMKFGSKDVNTDNNTNWDVTKGKEEPAAFLVEEHSHNFKVPSGDKGKGEFYRVEFNAEKGWAKFLDPVGLEQVNGKYVRAYSWYSGDDANDDKDNAKRRSVNAEGYYTYTFTYGDDAKNVVQVALFSNPKHDAARQAEYTVKKKITTPSNPGVGVKSKLNEGDYKDADETTESYGGDFRIEGSSNYEDNILVHLYNPGEYLITATMKEKAKDNFGNYISDALTVLPSSIIVRVVAKSEPVIVNKKEDDVAQSEAPGNDDFIVRQAFSPTGSNVFPGLIEVMEELGQGDFEVTLTPDFTSGAWERTSEQELDNAYRNALSGVDYKYATQGNGLYELYSLLGVNHQTALVDGFYREGTISVSVTPLTNNPTEGYKAYDVTFNGIPCSGVYTMKVTSKIPDQYDIKPNATTVYIYPNLKAEYGTRYTGQGNNVVNYGFNVEGFTFSNDDSIIKINKSFLANNQGNMGALSCFMPGTYFASDFTATAEKNPTVSQPNAVKRNASYAAGDYTSESLTNLSALQKEGDKDNLSVYVKKNGAQANYNFAVSANEGGNVATGIDSVEAVEDGEAVYYNLQGVKVQNPEHGIYVKVQNGKAEKVVL